MAASAAIFHSGCCFVCVLFNFCVKRSRSAISGPHQNGGPPRSRVAKTLKIMFFN
jgi:hypothetical protein